MGRIETYEKRLIYARVCQNVAAKDSIAFSLWLSHVHQSEFGEDEVEERFHVIHTARLNHQTTTTFYDENISDEDFFQIGDSQLNV